MFSLELLAHGKSHTGLIEGLVGGNCHLDFVTDSEQKETAFRLRQSNLSDNLIEALGEKLFADWADSRLTCLALHQLLVEHFTETCYINS